MVTVLSMGPYFCALCRIWRAYAYDLSTFCTQEKTNEDPGKLHSILLPTQHNYQGSNPKMKNPLFE
jgi:hypothetical protein